MLGFEVSPVVQYVIAFAIIAALLGLFAIVLRRIGGKRFSLPGQDRGRGRQPRLGIVDVYDLDRQRQLVLLRRDNVEHLVMLGGPNDLVVESNIVRVPVGRAPAAAEFAERLPESGSEQGRPLVEPAIAASAGVAINGMAAREQAQREPSVQQRPQAAPVAPPQPQPQPERQVPPRPEPVQQPSAPQPPRQPALQPSIPQPSPAQPSPVAPVAPPLARPAAVDSASAPGVRSELKPIEPVVTAAPPPPPEPRRGLFGFGRAVEPSVPLPSFPSRPRATPVAPDFTPQRTPPKFAPAGEEKPPAPQEDVGKEGVEGEPKADASKSPAPPIGEKPNAPEKVAASAAAEPKPGRSLDDAILSDMTRQLEAALKRPSAAAQPSPAQPSPAQPSPAEPPAQPSASAPQPAEKTHADGPSEPKLYKPVATAAATAAVASAFRSSASPAPTGPSSPVPPRPYGGVDEGASKAEMKADPAEQEEKQDVTLEEAEAPAEEQKPVAVETPVEISREEATQEPSAALEATPAEEPIEIDREDHLRELPPETIEPAAAGDQGSSAASQQGEDQGKIEDIPAPAPDAIAVESAPEAADGAQEASAEDAGTPPEADSDKRPEPTPVIDPFSVDEIEAEFARLLGRSVEKDQKNP